MQDHGRFQLLRRHAWLTGLASSGVITFGLIALSFFCGPLLRGQARPGNVIWLVAGLILAVAGACFLYISFHWSRQLIHIVTHTPPVRMGAWLETVRDSESTAYYVVLKPIMPGTGKAAPWRTHLWIYPTEIREDVGREFEADVFLNPETGRPAAIECRRGMLWVMAGNGAVESL